jgi:HlyD family secretion protein
MMSEDSTAANGPPSSPSSVTLENLDTLVRVTTVHSWVYLAAVLVVSTAAVTFAVIFHVPTKVNGEGILLIEKDTLAQVRAGATGRLVELKVNLGDRVEPGTVIGRITQEELEDAIKEAEVKRNDLASEDRELTAFEAREQEIHEAAMARVEHATRQAQLNSEDKLRIAQRVSDSSNRLRKKQYLGDSELLEAREKLYVIRDDLNKGRTRVAELDLERIKAASVRRRAQLERRLKLKQVDTKLDLDRKKLKRTSQIVSRAYGQVAQVLSAPGELVREGAPVVLLHAPKTEHGTDDAGALYDTIVFVSAGEGKKIGLTNEVEVSPATVKREEHGFIKGHVVAISELPATKLAMESALQHPELVDAFIKRYAPGVLLRVHVKLCEADPLPPTKKGWSPPSRKNGFRWSASSGPAQIIKTGTMCQAAIVVERRPLISLILPWTKKLLGTY